MCYALTQSQKKISLSTWSSYLLLKPLQELMWHPACSFILKNGSEKKKSEDMALCLKPDWLKVPTITRKGCVSRRTEGVAIGIRG